MSVSTGGGSRWVEVAARVVWRDRIERLVQELTERPGQAHTRWLLERVSTVMDSRGRHGAGPGDGTVRSPVPAADAFDIGIEEDESCRHHGRSGWPGGSGVQRMMTLGRPTDSRLFDCVGKRSSVSARGGGGGVVCQRRITRGGGDPRQCDTRSVRGDIVRAGRRHIPM